MNEEAEFLRQLAENPRDMTLRGVYADWLAENGRPAYAEVVRGNQAAPYPETWNGGVFNDHGPLHRSQHGVVSYRHGGTTGELTTHIVPPHNPRSWITLRSHHPQEQVGSMLRRLRGEGVPLSGAFTDDQAALDRHLAASEKMSRTRRPRRYSTSTHTPADVYLRLRARGIDHARAAKFSGWTGKEPLGADGVEVPVINPPVLDEENHDPHDVKGQREIRVPLSRRRMVARYTKSITVAVKGQPYVATRNSMGYEVRPEGEYNPSHRHYQVFCDEGGAPLRCSCPDNTYRGGVCKHMRAVAELGASAPAEEKSDDTATPLSRRSGVRRMGRAPADEVAGIARQQDAHGGGYDPHNHSDHVLADKLGDHGDPLETVVRRDLSYRDGATNWENFQERVRQHGTELSRAGSPLEVSHVAHPFELPNGSGNVTLRPMGDDGEGNALAYHTNWEPADGTSAYAAALAPHEAIHLLNEHGVPHDLKEPWQESVDDDPPGPTPTGGPSSPGGAYYARHRKRRQGQVRRYSADHTNLLTQLESPEHAVTRRAGTDGDHTLRLVAADALQEQGRDEEASALRDRLPVRIHNGTVHSIVHPQRPLRWVRQQDGRFRLHSYDVVPSPTTGPAGAAMAGLAGVIARRGGSPMLGTWRTTPTELHSYDPRNEAGPLRHVPVQDNWNPESNTAPSHEGPSSVAYQKHLDHWAPIHQQIAAEGRYDQSTPPSTEEPTHLTRRISPRRYSQTTDEASFHKLLAENPDDHHTRRVYADWLEDNGRPGLAGAVRGDADGKWSLSTSFNPPHPMMDAPTTTAVYQGGNKYGGSPTPAMLVTRVPAAHAPGHFTFHSWYDENRVGDVLRGLRAEGVPLTGESEWSESRLQQHAPSAPTPPSVGPDDVDHNVPRPSDRLTRRISSKVRYGAYRAPAGGMVSRGTHQPGGQFTPDMEGDFMKAASKLAPQQQVPTVSYAPKTPPAADAPKADATTGRRRRRRQKVEVAAKLPTISP